MEVGVEGAGAVSLVVVGAPSFSSVGDREGAWFTMVALVARSFLSLGARSPKLNLTMYAHIILTRFHIVRKG